MVIEWTQPGEGTKADGKPVRAAKYVRMSTEHQEHSTDNQTAAIELYAAQRGFEIVKTYADEGKSGLQLSGRDALKLLLADISEGRADFSALLVYDVSRFGRFQDPDEAASYELLCKRAGIAVHYCAEQFENDGTIGSSIIKTVKRAMAGEYSRELSVKVFAGQSHLISLGFRQGGAAGFGLRRMLVDQAGMSKTELAQGEHKSIATDRVILVPGPEAEIEIVREIYDRFCRDGSTELEIAQFLNNRGILSDLGRKWTRGSIHQILVNEKYIGNNVWGRTAFKLKQHHEDVPQEDWVRADKVFEPIVDQHIFDQAQVIIQSRSQRLSDDEMLELLRSIYEKNGRLTGLIIDEANDSPSSSAFQSRFGSLLRAYTLVGYAPDHDYRYIEINRSLRRLHPVILQDIVAGIADSGATVSQNSETDLLRINAEFTAAVVISRCKLTIGGSARWKIRLDEALKPDITIAVRMDEENHKPHDYYLLPRLDMREAILRMAEHNGRSLDAYRCETLERFYSLTARARLMRAA
ncbi:recombinase family protein [Parasphingorhabdus sp.]|uniref:recombinase family protein n=1 Tax=Parasphingorhabdus sp. TaxID=2709688 RepID=UPI003BAE55C2